jgi:hypothetical protein
MKRLTLGISLLLLIACTLFAQGPTTVQQTAQKLDAALMAQAAHAAGTLTLTPLGSQSIYIYEIDITNCAGASAVSAAAQTAVTTTNLPGTPQWQMGSGTTAGNCIQNIVVTYPTGLKATVPGTAVTVVIPAFATNQVIGVNVVYSSAP